MKLSFKKKKKYNILIFRLCCFFFNLFLANLNKIIQIKSNFMQLRIRKFFEIREIHRFVGVNRLIFITKTGILID